MKVTDIPQSNHIFFENILKVKHVGEVLVKDTIMVPVQRSLETHSFKINCDTMCYEEGNSLPHMAFIDVDIPQTFLFHAARLDVKSIAMFHLQQFENLEICFAKSSP